MEIKADIERKNGIVLFTIREREINHNNAASFKEKLFLEIADGKNQIVLNLTDVEQIDTSGLGVLTFGKRQVNSSGGNIVLVGVNPAIQSLLRIAQLTRVFEIFNNNEEAIQSFRT
jgi:anti-sigma B factor antagonist